MSFYTTLSPRFKSVPENGKIETLHFLEASTASIIPLLDLLGPTAFAFVKKDVAGNIGKLRSRFDEKPEDLKTLWDIIEDEVIQRTTNDTNSATDALIWLTRGLHFVCLFLKNLLDGKNVDEDIKPCIAEAYDSALKKHHYWIVQKAVQVAFKAAPYYSDLLKALQGTADNETLKREAEEYHKLLHQHVAAIQDMYVTRGLDPRPLT